VESVRNQPKSAERQQNAIQITRKANKIRENSGNKTSGFTVFQQTARGNGAENFPVCEHAEQDQRG
jgi:hypothetical protein